MAYQGKFETWTIQAKENLSNTTPGTGALYKAVNITDGKFASSAKAAGGILQQAGQSGDHVTLALYGVSKVTYATAVSTIGLNLTVTTSGFVKLAGSGDFTVGRNLTTVSCYGVGAAMINFLNPWYYESY